MCLAVPGKIVRWLDRDPILASAEVEFGGVSRVCHMACVSDAHVGDFVIVHAGIAISMIDPAQAARVIADLASLPEANDEWADDSDDMIEITSNRIEIAKIGDGQIDNDNSDNIGDSGDTRHGGR